MSSVPGMVIPATAVTLQLLVSLVGTGSARAQAVADDSVRTHLDTVVIVGEPRDILIPVDRQTIGALQLMPGFFEDPVRGLSMNSSTVFASDLLCMPVVGGEEPERTLVLFDGFPLAMPYRFLGAFSLFNPIMTKSVGISASGFPVMYGGYFPSSLQVEPELGAPKDAEIRADLSLPMSSVGLALPFGGTSNASLRAAVRTTHTGLISPFIPADDRDAVTSFIPVLRDAQVSFAMAPGEQWYLVQHAILTDEHGTLNNIDRSFDYSWKKLFLGTSVLTSLGSVTLRNQLSWTNDRISLGAVIPIESVGDEDFAIEGVYQSARWSLVASGRLSSFAQVNAGTELSWYHSHVRVNAAVGGWPGHSPADAYHINPAGFAETELALFDGVTATGGVRVTWFGLNERMGVEPRAALHAQVTPALDLTLGYGQYLRSPSDEELLYGFLSLLALPTQPPRMVIMSGNGRNLNNEQSVCYSAALRHSFAKDLPVSGWVRLSGYWKEESNLILPARYPSVFTVLDSTSFEPSQHFAGKKYGLGFSWRLTHDITHLTLQGGLSYQRSLITDLPTGKVYSASADIPWSLKLALQYDDSWLSVAMAYQEMSGVPATFRYYLHGTSIFGGSFYFPVWKDLNSDRLPSYRRVDLSASIRTVVFGWSVSPYIDIVNLMGWKNVSQYDFGLSESEAGNVRAAPVYNSLPFFPSFGVRVSRTL